MYTPIKYLGVYECDVVLPFNASTNYKYYWKVSFNTITNWNYLFRGDGGGFFIFGGTETSGHPQLHIGSNFNIGSISLQPNTLYECSLTRQDNSMIQKYNNTITNTLNYVDFTSSNKLQICGVDCNIYYLKVYDENDNLIYDFAPIRVNQVGYLYEKVSGKLFANQGSGSFTLGPDV